MDLAIKLLAGALVFWLIYWYLEVYTPRVHMREAIREVNAMFQKKTLIAAPELLRDDDIKTESELDEAMQVTEPRPGALWVRRPWPRVAVKRTPGRVARVPHA